MSAEIRFAPPGEGEWRLDDSHHGRRPLSRFIAETYQRVLQDGTAEMYARYGLPLKRIRGDFVNGCLYVQVEVLAESELAERSQAAAKAWRSKTWRTEVDQWFDYDRDQVIASNLAFQALDISGLDDGALAAHVAELLAHFTEQARLNMARHGGDIVPVGDFLAHCGRWGIPVGTASALLRGASPATTATAEVLAPAARAVAAAAPGALTSVASVRALGSEAADAVDAWFEHYAWRIVTTDDIDGPALAERPTALLAALLAALTEAPGSGHPDASSARALVPVAERDLFDELLDEARYGLRQRDDVVGVRWYWSAGLLRRALLEAGRRLVERGALKAAEHVVELAPDELPGLLTRGTGPTAAAIAGRARFRNDVLAAGPPARLGAPVHPPSMTGMTSDLARAAATMAGLLGAATTPVSGSGPTTTSGPPAVHGVGIGADPYTGTARVVGLADDALERLEPGDVLVAPFTGPAYNSILPLLGALVVEAGGPMSHAGISAREFGLPAVIGAAGAITTIPDGAVVEVDPRRGVVTVID